jgi:hypothetical protein
MLKFLSAHVTGVCGKDSVTRGPADTSQFGVVVIFQVTDDISSSCG